MKHIALKPRISEKGYAISEQLNTYIFDIPSEANKFDVAAAVSVQYDVAVASVKISSIPGKKIRSYRKGGRRSLTSQRSTVRKAYVTLKEGNSLPIFAAVEEPESPKENK